MKRSAMLTGLLLALWMMAGTLAEAAANEWVWIDSDTKYGKYYAPSHVKVESAINGVPTQLSAWTAVPRRPSPITASKPVSPIPSALPTARRCFSSVPRPGKSNMYRKIFTTRTIRSSGQKSTIPGRQKKSTVNPSMRTSTSPSWTPSFTTASGSGRKLPTAGYCSGSRNQRAAP